jgi:anti-sigma factor RsiW
MNTNHLTDWDQEEYVLGQRTPDVVQHLSQCSACRTSLARLEQGIGLFRTSAREWSAQSFEKRPLRMDSRAFARRTPSAPAWQWVVACLLFLALLPVYFSVQRERPHANADSLASQAPAISDDALLQQVDEEVSESVPSSMEPLTHLVTTNRETPGSSPSTGRQHSVQAN